MHNVMNIMNQTGAG